MVSSAIWEKTRTSEFFEDYGNSTSPKDECYLRARNHAILLINDMHDKIM